MRLGADTGNGQKNQTNDLGWIQAGHKLQVLHLFDYRMESWYLYSFQNKIIQLGQVQRSKKQYIAEKSKPFMQLNQFM
jgi:hypothetical protein